MADDELRDRLTRALTHDAALGGCQYNDYLCATHLAYLGPDHLYCTRITGVADRSLFAIRDWLRALAEEV